MCKLKIELSKKKLKSIKPCLEDFSMSEMVEYLRENGYKVKYKL